MTEDVYYVITHPRFGTVEVDTLEEALDVADSMEADNDEEAEIAMAEFLIADNENEEE